LCYNITLVKYLKRLLSAQRVPMGKKDVQVMHIFELCEEIIGEPVSFENETKDYYDIVIQEALLKATYQESRYDAILVDEGQDISEDMYRIVISLLNPATNNLTIAIDENQNLYQRSHSWSSLGINVRGRVHKIDYVYRNTKEISSFATKFIVNSNKVEDTGSKQLELFPDYFNFNGPKPSFVKESSIDSQMQYIASTIESLSIAENIPYSEIAIIYTTQSPQGLPDIHIPNEMIKKLEEKGILYNWASENFQSKSAYDITTNSVTISTIHSVKGFDYACAFVIGLDFFNEDRWVEEQIHKMTYVALTRARRWLFIPYINENALIKKLKTYIQ